MKCYSTIERNGIMPFTATLNVEFMILSEQIDKGEYHNITYTWNLKDYTNKLIYITKSLLVSFIFRFYTYVISNKPIYKAKTGFPHSSVIKNMLANAGEVDLIPGLGRSPGEGNGNPIQFSCLGNPLDRGS